MRTFFRAILCFQLLIFASNAIFARRSIHRPKVENLPQLCISWSGFSQKKCVESRYLYSPLLFQAYSEEYLNKKQLPHLVMYGKKKEKKVRSALLKKYINEFVDQLLANNRNHPIFKKFTILKELDFSQTEGAGVVVAEFNEYPLVIKVFSETPQSFLNPLSKGVQQYSMWIMAGGVNRHITGLLRIQNLDFINTQLSANPYWREKVITPRKWFMVPNANRWLLLKGKNINGKKKLRGKMPGVYVVICDKIEGEKLSFLSRKDRLEVLEFARYLENRVDPFLRNYLRQPDGKLALFDTEHLPTIVGIRRRQCLNSYINWYGGLALKFFKDLLWRTKDWFCTVQTSLPPEGLRINPQP